MVHSAFNNAPSPQRRNISPIKNFIGHESTAHIAAFIWSSKNKIVIVQIAKLGSLLNISELKDSVAEIHTIVQDTL